MYDQTQICGGIKHVNGIAINLAFDNWMSGGGT
jgi:hypothetical protein